MTSPNTIKDNERVDSLMYAAQWMRDARHGKKAVCDFVESELRQGNFTDNDKNEARAILNEWFE